MDKMDQAEQQRYKNMIKMSYNKSQHAFDFCQYSITYKGVKVLTQRNNKSIKELNLSINAKISKDNNNIGDLGMKYLVSCQWPSLWKLQLNQNYIGGKSIKFMVEIDWPELTSLQLSQNNIGNKGAQTLAKISAPKLRQLDLQLNEIGRSGFESLLSAQFPVLHTLNLSSNRICFCGQLKLLMKEWKKLGKIGLRFNEKSKKMNQFLKKIIPKKWGVKNIVGE